MMRRIWARMTYANVAATLALVFAMGGSAVAASHYLITSKKQISPKVVKELSGKQGAAGSAGAPGSSGPQGPQGAPGPAGTNGLNGQNGEPGPEGKQGPEGKEALTWNEKIETAAASFAAAKPAVLKKIGPFTLLGYCYQSGEPAKTVAATYIETSEEGSVFAETGGFEESIEKGEATPVGAGTAESVTATHLSNFSGPVEGPFSAQSKTGLVGLNGSPNEAVFLGGKAKPACYFTGTVTEEK
ncbi:MAG TPA: hypothetical protein VF927_10255 [Solirubrobacteraceae bacterium]